MTSSRGGDRLTEESIGNGHSVTPGVLCLQKKGRLA